MQDLVILISCPIDARTGRSQLEPGSLAQQVAELCRRRGLRLVLAPDIHHLAEDSPAWKTLAGIPGPMAVLSGLHPRPAQWILDRHGVRPGKLALFRLDAFTDAAACMAAIEEAFPAGAETATAAQTSGMPETGPEPELDPVVLDEPLVLRWYPVIDRSRCVDCKNCLQFCLFGVYGTDPEGRLAVKAPDHCKSGCPACSRICPQGAILFPLYDKDPAIAGAPGLIKTPDPAARKMFYERTGNTCPQCGRTGKGTSPPPAGGSRDLCKECGRPMPRGTQDPARTEPSSAPPVQGGEDLDRLIVDLDDLMRRRN